MLTPDCYDIFYRATNIGSELTEDITEPTNEVYSADLSQSEVIEEFDFHLKVGRIVDGAFNEIPNGDNIKIGEFIRVKLQTIDTDNFM